MSNEDSLCRSLYHPTISLQDFSARLESAATLAYPESKSMRYTKVSVLLLYWESCIPTELEALRGVFKDDYYFDVEVWQIPSQDSHLKLNRKLIELDTYSKDQLKIVYYGERRMPKTSSVGWASLLPLLQSYDDDILVFLDCCISNPTIDGFGNGATELIAACGINSSATLLSPTSFTHALTTELSILSNAPFFTIGILYNRIVDRMWIPSCRKTQKPPFNAVITQNSNPLQSISLSTFLLPQNPIASSGAIITSSRAFITITLNDTIPLSANLFGDWMQAGQIKIEAMTAHILIISMPVAVWYYLPYHPAISDNGIL